MSTFEDTKSHVKKNIYKWLDYLCYCYLNSPEGKTTFNYKSVSKMLDDSKNHLQEIANDIFDKVYVEIFWDEKAYEEFCNKIEKCYYCDSTKETMKAFYDHIQSDNHTRGQSFEIDRKVCRMKDYPKEDIKRYFFDSVDNYFNNNLLKNEPNDSLIKNSVLWLISGTKTSNDSKYKIGSYKEEILYLPTPYNNDNCVPACYWCNNAKTDAFSADDFIQIGQAIKSAVDSILNTKGNT